MGVPAFFHWLTKKYPSIIVNCIEENPSTGYLFNKSFI
jgi:5'-3' exoribonuclease 2